MGEEDAKKVEVAEASSETIVVEATKDVAEEKEVNTIPPKAEENPDESEAIAIVEKVEDPAPVEKSESAEREAILTRIQTEKKMTLITAWEDSEKNKAENRAVKKLSAITSWETTQIANMEAQQKKIQEDLEKKKLESEEKLKNDIATVQKEAEKKRAMVEAKRAEELQKAEKLAAKYSSTGLPTSKIFGFFGP